METVRSDITPELSVRRVALDSLRLDPANARLHDGRNLDAIKGSLVRFGQQKPIVVDTRGIIVAGNGTFNAARSLGWTEIDVVETALQGLEATAFAIADNRTSDLSEFDSPALAKLLKELQSEDVLDGVGFSDDEIDELLAGLGEIEEPADVDDDGPGALPEKPVSRLGDLWLLGDHRILVSDSRTPAAFDTLLDGEIADFVWTDPPYGVEYQGKTVDALRIQNDGAAGLGELLDSALGNAAHVCRPGAAWYVAAPAGPQFLEFARVLTGLGIWRQTLVWVKDVLVLGRSDYHYRHEIIVYGWVPGAAHQAPPSRDLDTVWEIDRPKASPDHPTTKPTELITRALEASSQPGALILDPFAGSGSTIIAGEETGRRVRAIELDPRYVDVAVRRWQSATGRQAMLDGRTFDEIESRRRADAPQDSD